MCISPQSCAQRSETISATTLLLLWLASWHLAHSPENEKSPPSKRVELMCSMCGSHLSVGHTFSLNERLNGVSLQT
eukprot:3527165-Pyramimonas_sp.AAC.1